MANLILVEASIDREAVRPLDGPSGDPKSSDGEHHSCAEIHHQTKKGQEIRVDSCRGNGTDDPVEQPFASGADRSGKSCHAALRAPKRNCALFL